RIDFVFVEALGLNENLVGSLVRETNDLVLDGRTITRPDAFNHPCKQGRSARRGANNLVRTLVCLRNETVSLFRVLTGSPEKREYRNGLVSGLCRHDGKVQ